MSDNIFNKGKTRLFVNNELAGSSIGPTTPTSFTTGSIIFAQAGVLAQDNSNLFWDDTNNRLGIGTNSPSTTLSVLGFTSFTSSGTPASGEPNYFQSTITLPNNNNYNVRSTYTVDSTTNNSIYRLGGILGETYIAATNTGALGWAVGCYGYIQNFGSGVITRSISSYNITANRGTGTVTNHYNVYCRTENDLGGTIGLNVGLYVATPINPTGTITINAGIYLEPQTTGVTNYAIYSAGAADNSFFAGTVTVNTNLVASLTASTGTTMAVGTSLTVGTTAQVTTNLQVPLIIGGTAIGSTITYKSTTASGTGSAHIFQGGNNGATELIRFENNGEIRIPNNRNIVGLDSGGSTYRILLGWSAGDNININGRPGVSDIILDPSSSSKSFVVKSTGRVGVYGASGTALLHIGAGTASASTAPLKFTTGTLNTTAEQGAIEYVDPFWYATNSGPDRRLIQMGGRNAQSGTTYTAVTSDVNKIVGLTNTAARTITLPAANTIPAGNPIYFKDEAGTAAAANITINRAGADTIDGGTSTTITTNYGMKGVYSNGSSAWFIM